MLRKFLGNIPPKNQQTLSDLGLLILRLGSGLFMIYGHGWAKMMKLFGDQPIQFANPIGLGDEVSFYLVVFAEMVCAILITIGLFTRWATVPLIITMLVGVFFIHWNDPFSDMEKALLYIVPYVVIFLNGPGRHSLDYLFGKE